MKTVYVCLVLFAVVCTTTARASDENAIKPKWDLDVGFNFSFAPMQVNSMPLVVRNVPIHKDDAYGVPGPITQQKYSTNGIATFEVMAVKKFHRLFLSAGVAWILYPSISDDASRNYTNAVGTSARGYGAALTYVGVGTRGVIQKSYDGGLGDIFTSITPKVTVGLYVDKEKLWLLAASATYMSFQAGNGWDRYDELESHKQYLLARSYLVNAYIQYKQYMVGYSIPNTQLTELGREAKTKIAGGPIIGIKFAY